MGIPSKPSRVEKVQPRGVRSGYGKMRSHDSAVVSRRDELNQVMLGVHQRVTRSAVLPVAPITSNGSLSTVQNKRTRLAR